MVKALCLICFYYIIMQNISGELILFNYRKVLLPLALAPQWLANILLLSYFNLLMLMFFTVVKRLV